MTARALLGLGAFVLAVLPATGAKAAVSSLPMEMSDATVEDFSSTGLDDAIAAVGRAGEPSVWVAYQVAGIPRHGSLCCGHGSCCEVEESDDGLRIQSTLESEPIVVLLRFADGEIDRIRTISQDCPVGFGGRRVLWAGPISTHQSLELLQNWITAAGRIVPQGAITAIAHHDDPQATSTLESTAVTATDEELSKAAIFWLGAARREAGLESLRRLLDQELTLERHKAAIFGLSQSPIAGANDELIRVARGDHREEIRRESLFWLGQSFEPTVGEVIYLAALEDASLEVAEHAVFVLSLLPQPRSVELLARLLVQRQRPELRKQALFWIGQTDSEDALEVVARILNE